MDSKRCSNSYFRALPLVYLEDFTELVVLLCWQPSLSHQTPVLFEPGRTPPLPVVGSHSLVSF